MLRRPRIEEITLLPDIDLTDKFPVKFELVTVSDYQRIRSSIRKYRVTLMNTISARLNSNQGTVHALKNILLSCSW